MPTSEQLAATRATIDSVCRYLRRIHAETLVRSRQRILESQRRRSESIARTREHVADSRTRIFGDGSSRGVGDTGA
jgi:hypothetical protein